MNLSNRLAAVALLSTLSACGMFGRKDEPARPSTPTTTITTPKPPDKGDPQQRFNAALDLHRKGQIAEAEKGFVSLTQDFPQFSGPYTNLGIIYAKSKRRAESINALNKALTLNPDNVVALNWIGISYREAGDPMRAKVAYEKALELKPDYALAHYNYAILLDEHLKRPTEALPHYKDYQRLSGKQDLKVLAWVAEIEARSAPSTAAPASAPAPAATRPAPAAAQPTLPGLQPATPPPAEPKKEKKKFGTFDDGSAQ